MRASLRVMSRFQRNRRVGALCVEIGLNGHANWPGNTGGGSEHF
jgi:hypothetical protein